MRRCRRPVQKSTRCVHCAFVTHFERPQPTRRPLALSVLPSSCPPRLASPLSLYRSPPSSRDRHLSLLRQDSLIAAPRPYDRTYTDHQLVGRRREHAPPHADFSPEPGSIVVGKGLLLFIGNFSYVFLSPFALDNLLSLPSAPNIEGRYITTSPCSPPSLVAYLYITTSLASVRWDLSNPCNHRSLFVPFSSVRVPPPQVLRSLRLLARSHPVGNGDPLHSTARPRILGM
jgi:hypothetical protein